MMIRLMKIMTEPRFSFNLLSEQLLDTDDTAVTTSPAEPTSETAVEDAEFLSQIYAYLDQWIHRLPSTQLHHVTTLQRHLRFLVRLLKYSRYPRLAILGRRGSGKSSLLNALLGQMVATPGHTGAQTGASKLLQYRCGDDGAMGMDVLDTRGLNEGGRPEESDESDSAMESVKQALRLCPVDVVLLVHKISEVDAGVEMDLRALQEVLEVTRLIELKTPVMIVLTHCDEVDPADLKRPSDYDDEKLATINRAKEVFMRNLNTHSPSIAQLVVGCVPVSCCVIWQAPDEQGRILPHPRRDYRYNIDTLLDLLLRNVDIQAVVKTIQMTRATRVKQDFADFITRLFASVGALMALTPFPTSDILPLTALITYLTYTISRLAPLTPLTQDRTKNLYQFLSVIGITSILGLSSRYLLTQMLKLSMIPGSSAGSAVISYSMVMACGHAARSYFVEGKDEDEVRAVFDGVYARGESDEATQEVDLLLKPVDGDNHEPVKEAAKKEV
jgi:predicted GTPase/uncharacterized protein (DUF697 family)